MSHFFGPPTQQGVVVNDLDRAIDHWTRVVGAGPFVVFNDVGHEEFFIGAKPAPAPAMRIAMGNWGDLQIELIEPSGDSEATWHSFLRRTGGGLHHLSGWTTEFDAVFEESLGRGLQLEVRGKLARGIRYAYFRIGDDSLVEISEITPQVSALYAFIRQANAAWDGVQQTIALPQG